MQRTYDYVSHSTSVNREALAVLAVPPVPTLNESSGGDAPLKTMDCTKLEASVHPVFKEDFQIAHALKTKESA